MSYMQCTKCGGYNGVTGNMVAQCNCPAVSTKMVSELMEAVANNQTVNETTNWGGVCVDLVKKGWKTA